MCNFSGAGTLVDGEYNQNQGPSPQNDIPLPKTVYLPSEMKAAVLAQLEKWDLKTVTLVSKEWNVLAISYKVSL